MTGEALEKRLAELEEKWLTGTITPEEADEYARWYSELDTEHPLPVPGSFATSREELRKRILENILSRTTHDPERERLVRRMRPLKWVAAASVILLVAGVLFLGHRSTPSKTAGNTLSADIPPGSNKAVLTLANGSTILLDSAHTGTLAQQGNAAVVKTDSGKLAYRVVAGNKPTAIAYNELATPRGGQYQLVLPDGTKVWLNAASSIRYPTAFTGSERKVEVTGEAYFEVHKNASQPFKVSFPGKEVIEVLGTSFNVNAYKDEAAMKTTLLDGSIRVVEDPLVGVNTNKGKISVVLKPGQQAQLVVGANTNNGDGLKMVRDVDVKQVVAWKNGQFQLGATDFSALMRQISRWYDVDIVYEGQVPEKKFGGSINRNVNLSRLREVLHDYGIETGMEGQKLIIMK